MKSINTSLLSVPNLIIHINVFITLIETRLNCICNSCILYDTSAVIDFH